MRELLTVRVEGKLVKEVESVVKEGLYESKADFVRAAIRSALTEYYMERGIRRLEKLKGIGKREGWKVPTEEEREKNAIEYLKEKGFEV